MIEVGKVKENKKLRYDSYILKIIFSPFGFLGHPEGSCGDSLENRSG